MQISKVQISNILGIQELEFEPGGFTEVSGRNGEGKTSVLEAIKAAIQPAGHDATLLRKGNRQSRAAAAVDPQQAPSSCIFW